MEIITTAFSVIRQRGHVDQQEQSVTLRIPMRDSDLTQAASRSREDLRKKAGNDHVLWGGV
jgi:hypothetical protein